MKRNAYKQCESYVRAMADLGFVRYTEYLASPLWAEIKKKVMGKCGGKCCCCQRRTAVTVHHKSYQGSVIKGTDRGLRLLVPLCLRCHDEIECVRLPDGDTLKRSLKLANKALDELTAHYAKNPPTWVADPICLRCHRRQPPPESANAVGDDGGVKTKSPKKAKAPAGGKNVVIETKPAPFDFVPRPQSRGC